MLEIAEPPVKGNLTSEKLQIIAGGYCAFQLLWAGISLGLYNLLSKLPGIGLSTIANQLHLEEKPARILMSGLVSLGLIESREGKYWNAGPVEDQLVDGKPQSIAPLFEWHARINYPALADFVSSLKENRNVGLRHFEGKGKTLYERLSSDPDLEEVFQRAMSTLSSKTNPALLKAFDFKKFTHILDVGGGDGTNAATLVKAYPHLKATVFDIPSVCKRAESKIKALGLDAKIHTHAGNFLTDPFPATADAILFNHIMPIWSESRNRELLRKSFAALKEGGAVLIFNMMSSDDESGPLTPSFGSLYFLTIATGEGMLYPWADYESWLHEAGFKKILRFGDMPLDHGLLVGIKG